MNSVQQHIKLIRHNLPQDVTLICVSKYQSEQAISEAYEVGERDFGESHVQELIAKHEHLPKDIRWHFIGHLQTNKVKYIVPFIHLIQSVDSWHLLETINREAAKIERRIEVLLEVHVAREESKTGMSIDELRTILPRLNELAWVQVVGLMTMATNTDDEPEIRRCFRTVHELEKEDERLHILSYGMSDDYPIAIAEGSTMVRIGSKIFGER